MNPLKSFILALTAFQGNLRERFNKATENLGPLEQIEAAGPILGIIREVDWAKHRMTDMDQELSEQFAAVDELLAGFEKQAGESAISAAIAEKTLLRAEDHETLITAAKLEARKEVETEFRAREKSRETITQLRKDLTTEIGAIAAASLTDEDLTAEDSAARIQRIKDRVAKVREAGVTAETHEKVYTSLLACAADEGGEGEFQARLEILAAVKPADPAGPQNPKKPAVPVTASGEKKKAYV